MRIEDSFQVAAPPATVWSAITDPEVVGACVPGCERVETIAPDRYKARVVVKVGPITARFELEVQVTGMSPPDEVVSVTRGEEGSRASVLRADNVVRLRPLDDGGTEISYVSEISLVGRLGRFGFGMMKKKAASLGAEFAAALEARLAAMETA